MSYHTPSHGGAAVPPDATELERAEANLAESHRRDAAVGLFARRTAHDLSNFITVIRTYSELLLSDHQPTDPAHADLLEIQRAADAMSEYLQRCARFARVGTAKPSSVSLDTLLSDLLRQAEGAGLGPFTEAFASAKPALVDQALLADALRELVANAREASPADMPITVRTFDRPIAITAIDGGVPIPAGHWSVVEIGDRGTGVDPQVSTAAFDPFVTTKHGVRGAGLGLAIARAIVWQAGGHLVLNSGPGGTRARVYLPVAE